VGAIEERLAALGLELPRPFSPPPGAKFPFSLVTLSGKTAYVAGHGPVDGSDVLARGKVGADVSPEEGYRAARLTALSILASLAQELGDLDRVSRWVKVLGFVNCAPNFDALPGVINGFTDLILELWGEGGRHARSAIGAAELPFGMSVEVEAICEVRPP
jgi:enamine deaminase RidA (YjgF/YER057c/UK114 family)